MRRNLLEMINEISRSEQNTGVWSIVREQDRRSLPRRFGVLNSAWSDYRHKPSFSALIWITVRVRATPFSALCRIGRDVWFL
jgi:hypothetical protein